LVVIRDGYELLQFVNLDNFNYAIRHFFLKRNPVIVVIMHNFPNSSQPTI